MKLPTPRASDGLRKMTQVRFYGYDAMGTEGGIRRMRNMTSDYWPELASREKRKTAFAVTAPRGIAGGNALIWIDGRDLHCGETVVSGILTESEDVRTIAVLGDYVTVWPDKVYYDTVSGESGSLDASVTISAGEYYAVSFGDMPGRYSSQANALTPGAMAGVHLSSIFKVGDAVTISGCEKHPANNKTVIVREFAGECMLCLDDTFEMDEVFKYTVGADGLAAGDYSLKDTAGALFYRTDDPLPALVEGDTLVIDMTTVGDTGMMQVTHGGETTDYQIAPGAYYEEVLTFEMSWQGYTETAAVTLTRAAPELDGVFAHENRLYGWKGDTIYASKWGDVFNWNVFDGTASDSWTTETGTPGAFTGGISFGGYPRFFKEHRIFILYGDYPSEFQLQELETLGVQAGSGRSLAAVNGRLLYLSPAGPCVYAGGEPMLIADAFGLMRYKNAAAGADSVKYTISMQDEENRWHLFVYDTRKGLWMREDGLHALGFGFVGGELYALAEDGKMLMLGRPMDVPEGAEDEEEVRWLAEFGDRTQQSPDKKRVTKVQLRMEMGERSDVRVQMLYDSDGVWREVAHLQTDRKKSVVLPIIPRRLDHFRLRIMGTGSVRVSSLAIEAAAGSER